MKRPLLFLLFLCLVTVIGCGGDRQTYANVKGTVTYNGKPLDKGQIGFSVEGKPPTVLDIVDGKFAGQAVVGSNKISVSATKKSATAPKLPKEAEDMVKVYKQKKEGAASGDLPIGMVDYIPPEWGSASKQMRVVETGAANEFDFNITGPS
jgi:hypothetical protein